MSRRNVATPLFVMLFLFWLSGCSRTPPQWEITGENRSDVPCSFAVTTSVPGGNGRANVELVGKGQPVVLIVGDSDTIVQSVRVAHGKEEQVITPKAELSVGKRYAVVVNPDGKLAGSISAR